MSYTHWRIETANELATLTLDVAGAGANALSQAVIEELERACAELASQPLKGVVIRSAKSNFIVGADVTEFGHIADAVKAGELARKGQQAFNAIAELPFPSVAVIHGNCLGGGLELALACTYRVARDDDGTRLGLPEVKLGIHPGFAGTVRLPPIVGDLAALDLMLTGRSIKAKAARAMGLVDDAVPERYLLRAAETLLRKHPAPRRAKWYQRAPHWPGLRELTHAFMRRQVGAKAHPQHYPAPYRILELWKHGAKQPEEARSLGEMLVSRTSRSLVQIFLLSEALKRGGKAGTHDIRRVHVIGAGVMGADIAIWAAHKGFEVTLQDRTPEILGRAMKKAFGFYKKKLKNPLAIQAAMDRLMPDLNGDGVRRADLVIEAIIEKLEAKQELFRHVERTAPKTALLATNTSSIPLEDIGKALQNPGRLVGIHFFNPVAQMQLVEIVRGANSDEASLARARAWTVAIERLPLDVKSSPGFLVNRILMPYLLEAVTLLEEGVSIRAIDQAALAFGMPMGPILLADTVGLDICLNVAEELSGPLGVAVPENLRQMVAAGKLGKKSGNGYYRYNKKGKPLKAAGGDAGNVPITERLVLRMLNEAMACLREQVVRDCDAVDAGMVYGTGFAPYLGGPMRYAEMLGPLAIRTSLSRLADQCGARFKPDAGWNQEPLFKRLLVAPGG